MSSFDVVVVGGGMAGLASAVALGRAGLDVTVLERAGRAGGRAASDHEAAAWLNQGPHALYRGGPAERALARLGIAWQGRSPVSAGMTGELHGARVPLPTSAFALLACGWLGFSAKVELARFAARAASGAPDASLDDVAIGPFLERRMREPAARAAARALVRVASYTDELERLSTRAALEQVGRAAKSGVVYLDGGWQTLVDGLLAAAAAAGVVLHTRRAARGVARVDGGLVVGCDDGTSVSADAVVLAVPPRAARALLPTSSRLARAAGAVVPARAACLDVVLACRPDVPFSLGIDTPTYLSTHSLAARLADDGLSVVHVAKYLDEEAAAGDPEADRVALEALLERACPAFRVHRAFSRFLPRMTVMNDLPVASRGGFAGRAPTRLDDAPGVFLAGDWVGEEGMLLDATLASAHGAAEAILSGRASQRRAAVA